MCELGQLIQLARIEKGYSQETLGKLADYPRQHIQSLEAGKFFPSDDALKRIANVLELPHGKLKALKLLDKADLETKKWMQKELVRILPPAPHEDAQ